MNPPPLSSAPVKTSSRGCFLYAGIALVTFLVVFMTACVITYMMPKKYESSAVYQIRPPVHMGMPPGQIITPNFFATEFEVIRATLTLKPVVQRLDLTTNWNMTEEEAINLLRGIVMVQNIRGTDLVKITVKHTDPEQARNIAKEVFLSYKNRREEKERELIEDLLKELEIAVLDQDDLVEEKRTHRDNILKRLNGQTDDPTLQEVQKEFETQTALLEKMREKLAMERTNTKIFTVVELHEEPLLPQLPSSPNVTINLILGAVGGVLLGLLFALLARLLRGSSNR